MRGHLLALALASWLASIPSPARAEDGALTLERAVALARERNERAKIVQQEDIAAGARLARARSFFFPDITLSGTYIRRQDDRLAAGVVVQSKDAFSGQAVASLPIFDARAIPAWRAAARDRSATQAAGMDEVRLLEYEAADAFLQALGVQQVQEAAIRRRELAASSLKDARSRFDLKLVGSNDVTRAELEVAVAEREWVNAGGTATTARLQLGFLLDTQVTGALEPPEDLLGKAARPVVLAASDLQGRMERPDLRAARFRAAAQRAISAEPMARLFPTIGASATWRMTNEAGFTGREEDYWFGLNASWTLFDGGERYADRRERRAIARVRELEADKLQRLSLLQVENALLNLRRAQAASAAAETATEVARRNARETAALYRQGLTGAFEAADSQQKLFEAEIAFARERYGLGSAWLGVPAAMGLSIPAKKESPDPLGSMQKETP